MTAFNHERKHKANAIRVTIQQLRLAGVGYVAHTTSVLASICRWNVQLNAGYFRPTCCRATLTDSTNVHVRFDYCDHRLEVRTVFRTGRILKCAIVIRLNCARAAAASDTGNISCLPVTVSLQCLRLAQYKERLVFSDDICRQRAGERFLSSPFYSSRITVCTYVHK